MALVSDHCMELMLPAGFPALEIKTLFQNLNKKSHYFCYYFKYKVAFTTLQHWIRMNIYIPVNDSSKTLLQHVHPCHLLK